MRFFFAPHWKVSPPAPRPVLAGFVGLMMATVPLAGAAIAQASDEPVDLAPASEATPTPPIEAEVAAEPTASERVVDEVISASSLLDALAVAEDGDQADALAREVQARWNDSGSPAIDLLMRRAALAIRIQNYPRALDLLDTVIALNADYAEAWNRRATVHFLRDDYVLSIADVQRVLRLEPRHFGALSGMGIMLDELGEDRSAQLFLSEALRVHPYLTNARERLADIERRLLGAPI